MIRFGPSGNSAEFYEQGYKHTFEAMKWVADKGLNAYEYSFGRGVRIGEETAAKIKEAANENGIALSVHAPFFINLATDDEEKILKNVGYFTDASNAARLMGADRVIFHPGSCAKVDRGWAFDNTLKNFKRILGVMYNELGFNELTYCPETMGKINQVGDLEEIIALCNVDKRVVPTIDFGHLHTRGLGALNCEEDFEKVVNRLVEGIGYERADKMHVHFSKIAYTKMGEKAHVTFADEGFGPNFAHLAPVLVRMNLHPRIICESKDTMAMDAAAMLEMYSAAIKKYEQS